MTPLAVSDLLNTSEIVAILAFVFGVIVMVAGVQLGASHKKGKMQDLANSGTFLFVAIAFFGIGGAFIFAPDQLIGFGTKIVSAIVKLGS